MKTYELTYIITPDITSEETEAKAKEFESKIQAKEGIILRHTNPTVKPLAYSIKNKISGFFGVLEFQIEPEKLVEFKEEILKDNKILRQIITIKNPVKAKKERRERIKPADEAETQEKVEEKTEPVSEEKTEPKSKDGKEKVELKDIEQKLEELLGE
jgi:ribosomal protein S6